MIVLSWSVLAMVRAGYWHCKRRFPLWIKRREMVEVLGEKKEGKDDKKETPIGPMARLCAPERSTTATQIYKDNRSFA